MQSQIPQKKSSLPLLLILLFVTVAGGGYYYYATVLTEIPVSTTTVPVPISTQVDWEKQIYNDPTYTTLVNPLAKPVTVGPKGNPTPFVQIDPSKARQ